MRESLAQEARSVIRFGYDHARFIHKFIQSDFELPRRENVVRVRGKTEIDRKKLVYPKSSSRSHTGEMSVQMIDPHCLQAQTNVYRLVEPKEIGAASPFIKSGNNIWAKLPFFCGESNFFQQLLFVRKIMHPFDDTGIPILRWLVFRIPDRKDRRRDILAIKLRYFAIAEGLSERGEPFEQVSKARHHKNGE